MKLVALILTLCLCVSFMIFGQKETSKNDSTAFNEDNPPATEPGSVFSSPGHDTKAKENIPQDDTSAEEEYMPDEQDIFSRKLFQKKLKTLSKKEKIIWAFKLAATNTFL